MKRDGSVMPYQGDHDVATAMMLCVCTFSDVYVFGIGEQVKKEQLNALASKKSGETHVFFLKDYETLGTVFNSIISKEAFRSASATRV